MSTSNSAQQQTTQKLFLQKAIPIVRICQDALNKLSWEQLRQQAKLLHQAASEADQLILDVQAQLLEQSAENRDGKRAGELLTRLKNNLATILTEVRVGNTVQPQPPFTTNSEENPCKRLGNYLVEAELLTAAQIEVALADQKATGARLGEILAARGWIKQGTIEFIMQKVILPDRQKQTLSGDQTITSQSNGSVPSQRNGFRSGVKVPHSQEETEARETLVDPSQSTYIY